MTDNAISPEELERRMQITRQDDEEYELNPDDTIPWEELKRQLAKSAPGLLEKTLESSLSRLTPEQKREIEESTAIDWSLATLDDDVLVLNLYAEIGYGPTWAYKFYRQMGNSIRARLERALNKQEAEYSEKED